VNPYASLLRTAAAQAQAILAPMTDPDDDGEFTIAGISGTQVGTMSIFEKVLVATPNGYEEQRQIKIATAVGNYTAAEQTTMRTLAAARARIVARGEQWNLTTLEPGAQFFVLTGVAA
jgi:hypothetical protein